LIPSKPLKPQDLLLKDVDGDGAIDMVVANSGVNTDPSADSIAILHNEGRGAFSRPVFVEVGDLPIGLVHADLDGDGVEEIVFANSSSAKDISRLRPDGGGSFHLERLLELRAYPTHITAVDLDEDGNVDLAATFFPSSDVLVFWNAGDSLFTEKTAVSVGLGPYFMSAADLNKDGKVDLVTANRVFRNRGEGGISVVINKGQRAFEAATNYHVNDSTQDFTIGDFNHDGFLDIAVTQELTPRFSVFLNARNGTFPSQAVEYSLPDLIWNLSIADFNRDGYVDLVGAGGTNSGFLLLNDGHGGFTDPVSLSTGTRPAYVKAADLDGDSDLDLAITNLDSDDITVLFNDGSARFDRVESILLKSWFGW